MLCIDAGEDIFRTVFDCSRRRTSSSPSYLLSRSQSQAPLPELQNSSNRLAQKEFTQRRHNDHPPSIPTPPAASSERRQHHHFCLISFTSSHQPATTPFTNPILIMWPSVARSAFPSSLQPPINAFRRHHCRLSIHLHPARWRGQRHPLQPS